ncbi:MAG: DUF5677 domain-containing protein [Chryseobacterium sp.]|uniref:DUF5677 domain-containing protein n=1 Tax=Chryseobacterium sp. TaxID=1871047 RepID=UPI0025C28132|nr:DUF5677 domain-containing protein [Chryseobacterium sp.]MCJ7933435.1 DUF5677 domain-containing protein [Chryseobacterium sp.]
MNRLELYEIVESFKNVSHIILLKFELHPFNTKETILRNFIAKASSLLNSISILIKEDQIGEATALYRLLIERYFYIEYLEKSGLYQEFKDWSFIKTFEIRNKMRSQTTFNSKDVKEELTDDDFQINLYQELKSKKINWIEPKIEDFSKQIDLKLLYSLGYDLGSSYVHPRADEGLWDALRIVKNEKKSELVAVNLLNNSVLLSNAVLALATYNSTVFFGTYLQAYCDTVFKILNKTHPYCSLKSIELKISSELFEKN